MNIVDLLLKLLSGGVGRQLAGMLNIGEDRAESGIKATLPALLAALTGVASTREGSERLASAVEGADDGILGNLGNALGSQGSGFVDKGSSMLGSLFPEGTLGSLSSILGKFTGLQSGSAASLLGALAPIVLGFLKRETKSTGFDPSSLTRLLDGQKENIARALPGGLGGMLSGVPGLGNLASFTQGARGAVVSTANRASATAKSAVSQGASAAKWVVPLLIALGLGLLAWTFWPRKSETEPIANRATTVTAARFSEEIAQQVATATSTAKNIFADATASLADVTDKESATEAAAKLPAVTDRLVRLKELVDAIPEPQREPILASVAKLRGTLLALIDKVMDVPGVAGILEPQVARLKSALDAFDE
jgi:hypothetical protein